jgi:hypothetical protein
LLMSGTNGYESDPIRETSCFFTDISVERTTLTLTPYLTRFAPSKGTNTQDEIETPSHKGVNFSGTNHAIRTVKTQHNAIGSLLIESSNFTYHRH